MIIVSLENVGRIKPFTVVDGNDPSHFKQPLVLGHVNECFISLKLTEDPGDIGGDLREMYSNNFVTDHHHHQQQQNNEGGINPGDIHDDIDESDSEDDIEGDEEVEIDLDADSDDSDDSGSDNDEALDILRTEQLLLPPVLEQSHYLETEEQIEEASVCPMSGFGSEAVQEEYVEDAPDQADTVNLAALAAEFEAGVLLDDGDHTEHIPHPAAAGSYPHPTYTDVSLTQTQLETTHNAEPEDTVETDDNNLQRNIQQSLSFHSYCSKDEFSVSEGDITLQLSLSSVESPTTYSVADHYDESLELKRALEETKHTGASSDEDSQHDYMTVCKPDILEVTEKHRDEEFVDSIACSGQGSISDTPQSLAEDLIQVISSEVTGLPVTTTEPPSTLDDVGHSTGSADEMDVVVSENAAVHTAVDSIASSGQGSISDTAQRLAEDLAQAISSRVTGLPVSTTTGPALTSTAPSQADQQLLASAGGLLSSLQDLLPGPGQPGVPPTSLSTVLQNLSSTYATGASSAPGLSQASTGRPSVDITTSSSSESVTSPSLTTGGPTFQFSTPPPLFPTLPVDPPTPASSLPDALGPLSPSPDQDPPAQPEAAGQSRDVNMAGAEQEVDVENVAVAAPAQPQPASEEPQEAVAGSVQGPGTSGTSTGPDYSAILGDIEIPEGVDPSFLAALPEDMRQEVIEEQRRLTRARQQPPPQPAAAAGTSSGAVQEVNPEFLAALPPNIQEEVLAQQRMEQLRQRQATSDPTEAVNLGQFFQTLPPSLRQSLLAEMEETQVNLTSKIQFSEDNLNSSWKALQLGKASILEGSIRKEQGARMEETARSCSISLSEFEKLLS